jgi:hypothetical protein
MTTNDGTLSRVLIKRPATISNHRSDILAAYNLVEGKGKRNADIFGSRTLPVLKTKASSQVTSIIC